MRTSSSRRFDTAFAELWHELKPKFEARGHKLELVLQPSGALSKRIAAGETGDAIVSTSQGIDGFTSPRARFPFSRG